VNHRTEAILSTNPRLVQRGSDWLAFSPVDAPLRVGVEAASEQEARERFRRELEAWANLAELPDPDKRRDE
jgi:hypothetical protein